MAEATESRSSLRNESVQSLLERLHDAARRERIRYISLLPRVIASLISGRGIAGAATPQAMKNFLISVSPEQGNLMYLTARAIGARHIVEFGTSFGVSTIYLAAAVHDNGGGIVIGSEMEPSKHERALAHLEEASLSDTVDIRLGDAMKTFEKLPESVDMVLLDGEKTLYLPILQLIQPKLRPGAVVLADNIFTFKSTLRPYVEYVQSGRNGFESATLRLADGFEYSCFTG